MLHSTRFKSARKSSVGREFFSALACSFFIACSAHADIGIAAVAPYILNDAKEVSYVISPGATTVVVDKSAGYKILDASKEFKTSDDTDEDSLIEFDISSNKSFGTITAPDLIVMSLFVGSNEVPLAKVNGTNCQNSIYCQRKQTLHATDKYLQAIFPGGSGAQNPGDAIRVSFYLRDYCFAAAAGGASPSICTSGSVSTPSAGTANTGNFKVVVGKVNSGSPPSDGASALNPTDTTNNDVQVTLPTIKSRIDGPTFYCPLPAYGSLYFPGDGEILLESAAFANTGSFPPTDVVILANKSNGTAVETNYFGYAGRNDLSITKSASGNKVSIPGFINSTSNSPVNYRVAFGVRDGSGATNFTATQGSAICEMTDVQTAAIYGFLKKGNCFIATGAFRDSEAAPVLLLREFRDRVLLRFNMGRTFVRWYYGWSPSAATWLLDHPEFRVPVIGALAPLVVVAWCWLHPAFGIALICFTAGLIALGLHYVRRQRPA